jgi:hypothetical protein
MANNPKRFDSDKLLEKGVEMPAVMLDKTLEAGTKVVQALGGGE